MGAGSEILTQEKDHDLNVVEIPITARYDIGGTSTKHPVVHGIGVINSLIGAITEKRPLHYIGLPGFVTFFIGVFFGIQLLQLYNQTRYFSLAYAMRVSIFMILGAIGLFILWGMLDELRIVGVGLHYGAQTRFVDGLNRVHVWFIENWGDLVQNVEF